MSNKNFSINTGLQRYTFTDSETGEVFASFTLNPTSVQLAKRCEEVAAYFEERKNEIASASDSISACSKYDAEIAEKINYLLGYDADKTLFSNGLTPTTITPDGDIFASIVLEKVFDAIQPELNRRAEAQKARAKQLEKAAAYTEKYESS